RLSLVTGGEGRSPRPPAVPIRPPPGPHVGFRLPRPGPPPPHPGSRPGPRVAGDRRPPGRHSGGGGGGNPGSPPVPVGQNPRSAPSRGGAGPGETEPRLAESRRVKAPRPGHADLPGGIKYLRRDLRDIIERASARETTARVAAGAFARMLLAEFGVEIRSGVRSLGPIGVGRPVPTWEELQKVDEHSPLRAIDRELEAEMVQLVDLAQEKGDTLGGAVTVIAHNVPVGLGSHVQWSEKLDGRLAQAVMSVPAVKAVEIGAGIPASAGFGSAAHDPIGWLA